MPSLGPPDVWRPRRRSICSFLDSQAFLNAGFGDTCVAARDGDLIKIEEPSLDEEAALGAVGNVYGVCGFGSETLSFDGLPR